jgi:UDP-glucuronate 4-epimerase
MAIHKFTRLVDQSEKIPIFGDGSARRDYTYIDDLIEGIIAVIQCHRGFETYNLGESQTTTLKELIHMIEEALGKKANIEVLQAQPGDVSVTYADISKAKRLLGYQPKVKMKEGIQRFVEWYKRENK